MAFSGPSTHQLPSDLYHTYPKDPAKNRRSWGSDRRGERVTKGKDRTDGKERRQNRIRTDLDIPMSLEVKDGKTADVPQRVHVDGEFSEEIHDRGRAIRKGEPQDEGG